MLVGLIDSIGELMASYRKILKGTHKAAIEKRLGEWERISSSKRRFC